MKKNTLFVLLTLIGIQCSLSANWEGWYAGGSANWEYFFGKRTDEFTSVIGSPASLSSNQSFHNSEAGFSLFTGFLCNISDTCWHWGLEPYAGYKFNENTISPSGSTLSLERRWDFGLDLRVGRLICEDTFLYVRAGPEASQFRYKSSDEAGNAYSHKWIPGGHFGVGIEKEFSCFRLGLEVAYSMYTREKIMLAADPIGGQTSINAKPRVLSVNLRLSMPLPLW